MKQIIVGIVIVGIVVFLISTMARNQTKSTTNEVKSQSMTDQTTPTNATVTSSELKVEDIVVGKGQEVKTGDTIVIHYEGTLPTGEQFDSSYKRGTPFETQIGVGQVIRGWDEGVIGMKVGGKRKLTIPPDKAYGVSGVPGSIPPNATLIFTLELLEIEQ